MCCRTNSFCCTRDMQKGIIIAGVIDILLLIALIVVNIVLQKNYLSLWFVVVVIADVLLIIGSKKSIDGLLMIWMVVGMINIVLLFISWIGMGAYGKMTVFVSTVCNTDFQQFNLDTQTFNDPNQNFDLLSTNNQINTQSNPSLDCQGAEKYLIVTYVCNAIFVFGLPIYYIYLWVVVKSHRENLMDSSTKTMLPMDPVP